jgi:hypothetical protein
MGNAYKKSFASDPATPAVREFIADMNAAKITVPLNFVAIADATGDKMLITMAYEDMVCENVMVNSDIDIVGVGSIINVENYDIWDINTAGDSGTPKCRLEDFSAVADNIANSTAVSLKDQTAGTKVGGFPFIVPQGTFLVLYVYNAEGGPDMYVTANAVFSLLRDQVILPPAIPAPPIIKTIRAS